MNSPARSVSARTSAQKVIAQASCRIAANHVAKTTVIAGVQLAECATKARLGGLMIDDCIRRVIALTLDATTSSMAKHLLTEMQGEVIDACLQMFGGDG